MPKLSTKLVELDHVPVDQPIASSRRNALGHILPGSTLTPTHYRPDRPCDGFGCTNIVEAGFVLGQQKRAFCSPACRVSFHTHQHNCGKCAHCGDAIYSKVDRIGIAKFCSNEHRILWTTERLYKPTGTFRPLIENYLATVSHYRGRTLIAVKVALVGFFAYIYTVEGVTELNSIKPSMVSRFNAAEKLRGITTTNSISFVSMFFKLTMAEDDMVTRNPVIPNVHNVPRNLPGPRPYQNEDMKFIWEILEERNNLAFLLAFAIGEECGLRIGEVCNIRLEDVDQHKQTIFVRLPTKNLTTRTVKFSKKVAALLPRWLAQRAPACGCDNLLHSVRLKRFTSSSLDTAYRKLFSSSPAPALGFSFHGLRHTWASRLVNAGMELAVLMLLGGWKNLESMRRYVQILQSTIDEQYAESYRKVESQRAIPREPALSLLDFASLAAPVVPDAAVKAA